MISVTIEQRIVVKFHVKLGKTATETYNLLKEMYGHECLSRARVFEWFKRFQDGREDVEDDSRPGCPSTSKTDDNIETIDNLVRSDRRLSIGETVGIDKECVRQILHNNFNMKKVCAEMVPKILTFEQQEARKNLLLDHPPYSSDLAPCDFYLFPKVKSALKGTRFESVEAVKEKAARVLKELTEEDFQHCFK
ncbi:FLJ37770-like protein [Acromyrmex echinatior]|uniref:FLJ37770-like protein n=1 Tax=Acromyrmex echinatior TaxID=103372 RepID=F4WX84_ACREC|nr:FLJ37770-like protein [Acromyrmex echinatior]